MIKTRRIKGLLVSFLSDGSQDSRLVEATACHLKEKRKKNAPRKAVHAYEIDNATESKPKPKSLFDSIPLIKGHTASLQREFSRGLFMVAPLTAAGYSSSFYPNPSLTYLLFCSVVVNCPRTGIFFLLKRGMKIKR